MSLRSPFAMLGFLKVILVYLENARALIQGSFVLIFLAVAYFIHLQFGMILVAFQGFLIVQSSFTNWCIPDPLLRRLGYEKRCE